MQVSLIFPLGNSLPLCECTSPPFSSSPPLLSVFLDKALANLKVTTTLGPPPRLMNVLAFYPSLWIAVFSIPFSCPLPLPALPLPPHLSWIWFFAKKSYLVLLSWRFDYRLLSRYQVLQVLNGPRLSQLSLASGVPFEVVFNPSPPPCCLGQFLSFHCRLKTPLLVFWDFLVGSFPNLRFSP